MYYLFTTDSQHSLEYNYRNSSKIYKHNRTLHSLLDPKAISIGAVLAAGEALYSGQMLKKRHTAGGLSPLLSQHVSEYFCLRAVVIHPDRDVSFPVTVRPRMV